MRFDSDTFEIRFLKQMAQEGHNEARQELAKLYMEGRGVEQSDFMALKYLGEITQLHNPWVNRMMAEIFTRDRGVPPNPPLALKHYRTAYNRYRLLLNMRPMNITHVRLGVMCERGQGVDRDIEKAGKFYRTAAEQGDVEGLWKMVELIKKDVLLGLLPIEKQAFKDRLEQVTASAEGQDPALQYQFGCLFSVGRSVPRNYMKAISWFKKAAKGEFPPAMFYLAECYEHGLDTSVDIVRALQLYTQAANAGHEKARYRASVLLLKHKPEDVNSERLENLLSFAKWKTYSLGALLTEYVRDDMAKALMDEEERE
jgi:TPR repeat protein